MEGETVNLLYITQLSANIFGLKFLYDKSILAVKNFKWIKHRSMSVSKSKVTSHYTSHK
jgi:hypothetical protein